MGAVLSAQPPTGPSAPPPLVWWHWFPTSAFLLKFALDLLCYDVLLRLCHRLRPGSFYQVVSALCRSLVRDLRLTGAKVTLINEKTIPADRPLLIVSNHQSLLDIPIIRVLFGERETAFVAKVELARGLPFVSYNLRHGGNILIKRADVTGSIRTLLRAAPALSAECGALVVFPEGTRQRQGIMGEFKGAGLAALLRKLPRVAVVAVALDGSWRCAYRNLLPVPWGVSVKAVVQAVHILDEDSDRQVILQQVWEDVRLGLDQLRGDDPAAQPG